MTGQRSQLINFVSKFMGTVRFGNDHVATIMGYGDYQIGNVTVSRVYYVEGLGHNLFLVGQFCDADLEVAFRKHTCLVRDLEGVYLLKGSRGTNLYTMSLEEMMQSSPICLLSKASKTKNVRKDNGIEFVNQTLQAYYEDVGISHQTLSAVCLSVQAAGPGWWFALSLGKRKKHTHKSKSKDLIQEKLYLLHIDLCGPMRIKSINEKKYILVIVDDYSRLYYYLVAEARDILLYLNRSLIRKRHNKTPYELIHDKKPDLPYFHIFGALCYPTNDSEDLGKMKPKADIGIFIAVSYSLPLRAKKATKSYNKLDHRLIMRALIHG
ncbi:retrovirus-related pol polyprotein from transposon TNT 1-94 [Tanacetum coccineum]|uniref:Retrovirus-related pol polyprotein from transposon TNT 1-94 n=1 Tax=Tanacetum coccineum TaxID=301880 RepID=A0ABQ4XUE7_9ASTR